MAKITLGQAKRAQKAWKKARRRFLKTFSGTVDENGVVTSDEKLNAKIKRYSKSTTRIRTEQ